MPVSRENCDKERRELDLVDNLALVTKSTTRSQEAENCRARKVVLSNGARVKKIMIA